MAELNDKKPTRDEKLQAIDRALEKAVQLTPSVDLDETHWANAKGVSQSMLSRCPSCFADIESDSQLDSQQLVCGSCQSLIYFGQSPSELEEIPHSIGAFRLTRRLGIGAFGQVWLAYDQKLDRQVAVKFPRTEHGSENHHAMFVREARNVAQLRHPNIVQVHEVGTEKGLAYIVSEYVDSESLDQWLTHNRPSFPESAELCITISEALDAAHQQNIIHRDLKPSNILIDSENQPYITDFGLSKRESDRITINVEGSVLGTPAYMSPEQASGKSRESDARSDVYSLGVILFELLTGEKPFRGSSRMLINNVINELPPGPRTLNPNIPRDLETICLKCLEKKPGSRYASAKSFADDLRRWTENKPIQARPAGNGERLLRWCQRNRVIAGLITAVFATLLIGLAGVTWQWQKTKSALDTANQEKRRGDRLLADAQNVVDEFLVDISMNDDALRRTHHTRQLRRRFLEKARDYYQSFLDQSGRENTLLVKAWLGSADVSIEFQEFERAEKQTRRGIDMANHLIAAKVDELENRRHLVHLNNSLGRACFANNKFHLAEASLNESIRLCDAISKQDPDDAHAISWMASSEDLLGTIARLRCHSSESAQHYRHAENLLEQLHATSPDNQFIAVNLANVRLNLATYWMKKEPAKSRGFLESALEILFPGMSSTSVTFSKIKDEVPNHSADWSANMARALLVKASLHSSEHEFDEVLITIQDARNFYSHLKLYDPDRFDFLLGDAKALTIIGITKGQQLDKPAAVAAFGKAFEIMEELKRNHPNNIKLQLQHLWCLERSSTICFNFGETQKAVAQLQAALEISGNVMELFPDIPTYRFNNAMTQAELGNFFVQINRIDEATAHHLAAENTLQQLIAEGFDEPGTQGLLADIYYGLAADANAVNDYQEELSLSKKSIEIRRRMMEADPEDLARIRAYRSAISALGLAYLNTQQFSLATETFKQTIELTQQQKKLRASPEFDLWLGGDQVNLANSLSWENNFKDALQKIDDANANLDLFLQEYPKHRQALFFRTNAKGLHAQILMKYAVSRMADLDGVETQALESVVADSRRACELTGWKNKEYVLVFADALHNASPGGPNRAIEQLDASLINVPKNQHRTIRDRLTTLRNKNQ